MYADGASSDVLVLELPRLMVGGLTGDLLSALVTAGAFAAFLSTSSGLTIAVAGVLSQDAIGRGRLGGVTAFRLSAVVAIVVPCAVAIGVTDLGIARAVGLAFGVAASTFCPLLVLGIWWRGLTDVGAVTGLVAGFLGSSVGVIYAFAPFEGDGWGHALLAQPAAWSVPLAFATMVLVSRATRHRIPRDVNRFMVRLHTPEAVVLDRG
ncbi:sodium:solute symporter family transporter [Nocardioides alcanivorans]|uniref:sodium:solute symporter family transporter n=1 Tax=Nocardioides alcanivorans TaxID=2897352 RepID=UPI0028A2B9B4|nr:hypothetical protein [Nocardioides alcanivorans]